MWVLSARKYNYARRTSRFFLVCLSHDTLVNHFKTNFALMQHFNYSLYDIETMMPWEREIYLVLLKEYLKEREEEARRQEMG
jgi:hypothetical protein